MENDPVKAEKLLNGEHVTYDCILLDIVMPGKSGIALCQDIRAIPTYRNTPILMITQLKDRDNIDAAFKAGASDYITKPFDFVEVGARIKVASRLIAERKAAIDSYLALRLESQRNSNIARLPLASINEAIDAKSMHIEGENLVSLQVFENYLGKLARSDKNNIKIVAIQINNIDDIYTSLSPDEFLSVLNSFLGVLKEIFVSRNMFVSHVGMGMFIFSTVNMEVPDLDVLEGQISERLQQEIEVAKLAITVGEPVQLYVGAAPNFDRLVKVAKARIRAKNGEVNTSKKLALG